MINILATVTHTRKLFFLQQRWYLKAFGTFLLAYLIITNGLFAQTGDFRIFNSTNTSIFTGNNFKSVAVGKGGDIWAGTQYQGLYKYNHLIFAWEKCTDLTNVFINHIQTDQFGGIWIAQSGISGTSGGGSNIAGGVNYFPEPLFSPNNFYTFATGGGLTTRNVRSIWVDNSRVNVQANLPRVWAAQATFITSGNTAAGGISGGLNAQSDFFTKVTNGLQVFPYTSMAAAGTPSCDAVGGYHDEVWVATRQNFGKSQILRYHPLNIKGTLLGTYDNSNVPQLSSTFRANAIYFDSENRGWIGLNNGGLIVKSSSVWKTVNMPDILPAGTVINNNAITGDNEGNVYIGTSNGLLVYEGGPVDASSSYTKYVQTDGLPSNNITGIAADNDNRRIILATDNGVVFWQKNRRIDARLVWDNSFPTVGPKPKGVAADGVSRLYIKVKRGNDTIPAFKKVELICTNYSATTASLTGTVKKADTLLLTQYSNEANSGTSIETSRTDSTVKGEYWFWYVSPEDFCLNELSPNAYSPERKDTVKIRVTFNNDSKDSIYLKVRVVRPPLVMVHGLASSPAAWDSVKYNTATPLLQSDLFKYKHALKMDGRGSFIQNAILLLAADIGIGSGDNRLNTLPGNIAELRKMGYAANQVDYLCHSMGGNMGRSVVRWLPAKFYADGNYEYNNYGKGFMHKMITVNTPHHGSPIPDATGEYLPLAPSPVNTFLETWYNARFDDQMPWDFLAPDYNSGAVKFGITPAVTNLQVSPSKGGIRQVATPVKNHLIIGDVNWLSNSTASVIASADQYIKLMNNILTIARDVLPPPAKTTLNGFLALGESARALSFLEWYSQNKGFPNFLGNGDLIVPLGSQTARQAVSSLHITEFNNSPGTIMEVWHSAILSRVDVGKRILDLINTQRSSAFFANEIPPNLDPDPTPRPASTLLTTSVSFDTSKIVLYLPSRNGSSYADSNITIKFRLKDTAKLAYIRINFQGTDTFNFGRTAQQQFIIKANAYFTGRPILWAMAIYDQPGNVEYHIDTLGINISNLATIQGFRATVDHAEIAVADTFKPAYQIKYNNQWWPLAGNTPGISASFDTIGVVQYQSSGASFLALKEGFTQAWVSYQGFTDTININSFAPLYSNCINRSIASGSFKNPAIWSKGVVPDRCDSVVIQSGHTIVADTSVQVYALRIQLGGQLILNNASITLQIGERDLANRLADNYGTLLVSNGTLKVNGRLQLNNGATFNMTGGNIILDGNSSEPETSLPSGSFIFHVGSSLQAFAFTGGTLQIIDPPSSAGSQSINCTYHFGSNSTLMLGDGSSAATSSNPNGFGGNGFPAQIGKLIIHAGSATGNRKFVNTRALTVKGRVEVRTGSALLLQAPLNVLP